MARDLPILRGRGTASNPPNPFLSAHVELDPGEGVGPEGRSARTRVLEDRTRSVLSWNTSPDLGFNVSLNPYRGCEHGCAYCYARPTHEYLGFSAGLDFEQTILAKPQAPRLLRKALSSPRWVPQTIAMSGGTDPYQPVERRLGITRGCLEVLSEFRNPVAIITKNRTVIRDLDLLRVLADVGAVNVAVSVTTLDRELQGRLEPRTSSPRRRLEAIATLAEAGIPVSVMVAPIIPGLTDHELPAILEEAARAGARGAAFIPLRLPGPVAGLFDGWLAAHVPGRREKVLGRVRSLRGGCLDERRFGVRMRGEGRWAEQLAQLFRVTASRLGLQGGWPDLSAGAFRVPGSSTQLSLFGVPGEDFGQD
jgi:DNA repair photolyase